MDRALIRSCHVTDSVPRANALAPMRMRKANVEISRKQTGIQTRKFKCNERQMQPYGNANTNASVNANGDANDTNGDANDTNANANANGNANVNVLAIANANANANVSANVLATLARHRNAQINIKFIVNRYSTTDIDLEVSNT